MKAKQIGAAVFVHVIQPIAATIATAQQVC